jgi:hypothetical protein
MRLLAFSGLHRNTERVKKLEGPAGEADTAAILGAGQCWGGEAVIGTTPVVNVGPDGRLFEL